MYSGARAGSASNPRPAHVAELPASPPSLSYTMPSAQNTVNQLLPDSQSPSFSAADGSQDPASDAQYADLVGKQSAWYHGSRYSLNDLWSSVLVPNNVMLRKCLKAGLNPNYCRFVQLKGLGYGVRSLADVAAFKNDIRAMQTLLEYNVDISGSVALSMSKIPHLRRVFKQSPVGAKVRDDQLWSTPLHEACRNGHLDMLTLLLEEGAANPDTLDSEQKSALFIATKCENSALAEQLLLKGANIELGRLNHTPPLVYAAYEGNYTLVKFLLERGAKIDSIDLDGETAFFNASRGGYDNVMKILAAHGADVEMRNCSGFSPFFTAAGRFKIDTMNALIKCGVDVDCRDSNDCTVLLRAVLAKNMPLLTFLLSRGAGLDLPTHRGWTPLFVAMAYGDDQLILYLLLNGCDVSTCDGFGNSPIHHAATLDSVIAISYILRGTARIGTVLSQENAFFETPLSLACKHDHVSVVKVLLKHGADIRHRDTNGFTALDRAMYHGSYSCVRVLLQARAVIDTNSIQCLHQGCAERPFSHGYPSIFTLLRNQYGVDVAHNVTPWPRLRELFAMNITREELLQQMRKVRKLPTMNSATSGDDQSEDCSDDPFNPPTNQSSPFQIATPPDPPFRSETGIAAAAAGGVAVAEVATNLASLVLSNI